MKLWKGERELPADAFVYFEEDQLHSLDDIKHITGVRTTCSTATYLFDIHAAQLALVHCVLTLYGTGGGATTPLWIPRHQDHSSLLS